MTKEFVREGKLDREAAAAALRDFLQRIVSAGKFELSVKVRTAAPSSGTEEGEAEVFADLDGKDKEILMARGGEVLKALEHLAFLFQLDLVGNTLWLTFRPALAFRHPFIHPATARKFTITHPAPLIGTPARAVSQCFLCISRFL